MNLWTYFTLHCEKKEGLAVEKHFGITAYLYIFAHLNAKCSNAYSYCPLFFVWIGRFNSVRFWWFILTLTLFSFSIQCSRVESGTVIQGQERTSTSPRTRRSSAKVSQGSRSVLTTCYSTTFLLLLLHIRLGYCNLVVKSQFFSYYTHRLKPNL